MSVRKDKLPKLDTRASFEPSTANDETRTVDVVATTTKPVLRGFWDRFYEILDMKKDSVVMTRMDAGAPLLDSHDRYSGLAAQIGVVEKAWLDGDKMMATVRFSKNHKDADRIWGDVKDGILRNISIGYTVHKYEQLPKKDPKDMKEIATYLATRWEPMEISLVTVPADEFAGVRSQEQIQNQQTYEVEIVNQIKQEENPMKTNPENPGASATPVATDEASIKAATEAGVTGERQRVIDITEAVKAAKLDDAFAQSLIKEGKSADQARQAIIAKWAEKGQQTQSQNPSATIEVGVDQKREHFKSNLENVIESRMNPKAELKREARDLEFLSLKELARESLRAAGLSIGGSPMEMVGRALHSTSDFPIVMANVISKQLQAAYQEAPMTWKPLVNETDLPDFKKVSRSQIGDFPQFEKVNEGGEFKRGTLAETGEEYKLATYGKIIGVTRQMIINDDLGALMRVISGIGGAANAVLSDIVWDIFVAGHTAAYNMQDGQPLFSAAHKNIAASNAAVTSGLAGMRTLLKQQKSLGQDSRFLNLTAGYLITGVERDDEVEKAQSERLIPNQASNDNNFIKKLQAISDPRLAAAPYFIASNTLKCIEVGYLAGTGRGIYTEQRMGFDVDGLEIKARLDAAAKPLEFRGLVRNAGT